MKKFQRIAYKAEQIASFFGNTRTPLQLTLDTLKLKRQTFTAVTRSGIRLRIKPHAGESFTFFENLVRRHYLLNGITLRTGDTVVDIGANIGSFAVLAASLVGNSGRVIAIEPVDATFKRLVENVSLNHLQNVTTIRGAVDEQPGTIRLHIDPKSALTSAHGVNATHGDQFETAPCFTLAQIAQDQHLERIALLKVDCEGSEYGIFESMPLELAQRIDQISMEVHPITGKSFDGLEKRLGELGFELHKYPMLPWVAFNRKHRNSA